MKNKKNVSTIIFLSIVLIFVLTIIGLNVKNKMFSKSVKYKESLVKQKEIIGGEIPTNTIDESDKDNLESDSNINIEKPSQSIIENNNDKTAEVPDSSFVKPKNPETNKILTDDEIFEKYLIAYKIENPDDVFRSDFKSELECVEAIKIVEKNSNGKYLGFWCDVRLHQGITRAMLLPYLENNKGQIVDDITDEWKQFLK